MNFFNLTELGAGLDTAAQTRCARSIPRIFVLSVFAGFFIGAGGMIANTAAFGLTNPALIRLVSGLLFPVGLMMVVTTGSELFTGAVLLISPAVGKKIKAGSMAKLWTVSYIGNFAGAVTLAWLLKLANHFAIGGGKLAEYTAAVAEKKAALSFGAGFASGVLCNILVCVAVLMSLCAKDLTGKLLGAYIPIAVFVIAGLEHSIANMYYIFAGAFAGADILSPPGVIMSLLSVTLGNIAGGVLLTLGVRYTLWTK